MGYVWYILAGTLLANYMDISDALIESPLQCIILHLFTVGKNN